MDKFTEKYVRNVNFLLLQPKFFPAVIVFLFKGRFLPIIINCFSSHECDKMKILFNH